jgi:hypothetical protein
MFRRTIVATVMAAFLAVLGIGCSGSEAQPVLKNSNLGTLKREPQKVKPSTDD